MSTGKKILLVIVLLAVAGGVYGWIKWHQPHDTVENHPAESIAAAKIYGDFSTNEKTANVTYLNKVIQVSGKVSEVNTNGENKQMIIFAAGTDGSIQCTMREAGSTVKKNDSITVKGFCNGYMNAIEPTVILSDGVIVH